MKNQKGITLVALVVTIVVLLILAGITIAAVLSDNSIFNSATNAKTNTGKEQAKELVAMGILAVQTNLYAPEVKTPASGDDPAVYYNAVEAFQRAIGGNATVDTTATTLTASTTDGISGNAAITMGGKTYTFTGINTKNNPSIPEPTVTDAQ